MKQRAKTTSEAAGTDHTVRVWDLTERRHIVEPPDGHGDSVVAVATADVGGRSVAVTGSVDGTARVWDLATGETVGALLAAHTREVLHVAAGTVDGRPVAVTGSYDHHAVRVWDVATARPSANHWATRTD